MPDKLEKGDKVEWETSNGKTSGTVKKKTNFRDKNQRSQSRRFKRKPAIPGRKR